MTLTLDQFNYHLPPHLIAQTPAKPADSSKLMSIDRLTQSITHHTFHQLPTLIPIPSLFVFNTTKVRPVRILTHKPTGGKLEIFITQLNLKSQTFTAWVKPGLKPNTSIFLDSKHTIQATLVDVNHKNYTFRITRGRLDFKTLDKIGHTPLPPYIKPTQPENKLRRWYQPIFARQGFSVAAPTASLHFTHRLLDKLKRLGHQFAYVQLDVGIGTFEPVKTQNITKHQMHSETYTLTSQTARLLNQAKVKHIPIIAVGTTVARTLESAFHPQKGFLPAYHTTTNLFIHPPYKFQAFDMLITNFHLPKSTLLMLVSAFTSYPNTPYHFTSFQTNLIGTAYQTAIKHHYRFFSFGDAMLIK